MGLPPRHSNRFPLSRNYDITYYVNMLSPRTCSLDLEPSRNIWYFCGATFGERERRLLGDLRHQRAGRPPFSGVKEGISTSTLNHLRLHRRRSTGLWPTTG